MVSTILPNETILLEGVKRNNGRDTANNRCIRDSPYLIEVAALVYLSCKIDLVFKINLIDFYFKISCIFIVLVMNDWNKIQEIRNLHTLNNFCKFNVSIF